MVKHILFSDLHLGDPCCSLSNKKALTARDHYLNEKQPVVFIYGHTHEPGYTETVKPPDGFYKRLMPNRNIKVWNTSSFIKKRNRIGSFLLIDDAAKGGEIKLVTVNTDGKNKLLLQGGVS